LGVSSRHFCRRHAVNAINVPTKADAGPVKGPHESMQDTQQRPEKKTSGEDRITELVSEKVKLHERIDEINVEIEKIRRNK
jgi:hypothetical protein